MYNNQKWFTKLHDFYTEISIAGVNTIKIVGRGTVNLTLIDEDSNLFQLSLLDVAFLPTSRYNLLL